jgi:hypothetical protein
MTFVGICSMIDHIILSYRFIEFRIENLFVGVCKQLLSTSSMPALSVEEAAGMIKVKPAGGEGWEIQFDKKRGLLSSWQVQNHSLFLRRLIFYHTEDWEFAQVSRLTF